MPTPTTLPDTPNMVPGNTRPNAFGSGFAESDGINEIIADLLNAWTRLGVGSTTPDAIHKSLKATAAGETSWDYHTMVKLAEATGTGASGVLTFSSIPQTFGEIYLRLYGRSTVVGTGADVLLTLNGNTTAANYDYVYGRIAGTTPSGLENLGSNAYILVTQIPGASSPANLQGSGRFWIPEYANAASFKSLNGLGAGSFDLVTGDFRPSFWGGVVELTAAITSLALTLSTGNWATTSKAVLYGLP